MTALPDFAAEFLKPISGRQSYVGSMAEKLAVIVTDLVNKNEPLLKAECNGVEITVTERGGSLAFRFCIEPEVSKQSTRETGSPNKQPVTDQ